MNRYTNKRLKKCLQQLEEQSRPTFNDRSYPQYVNYINALLQHLGKERIYLVGSTTENLKVRWSKDGGDADFILLSGRLEIPVEDIVFREDLPCYLWVKGNTSRLREKVNVRLIDDTYFPSDVLRGVSPELFTALRGVYLLYSCGSSHVPRSTHVTKYGLPSKVGLAMTEYRDLTIKGKVLVQTKQLPKKRVLTRNEAFRKYIKARKIATRVYKQDVDTLERAVEFISSIKIPGSVGTRLGHFEHFAYLNSILLERLQYPSEKCSVDKELETTDRQNCNKVDDDTLCFDNDIESASIEPHLSEGTYLGDKRSTSELSPKRTEITDQERTITSPLSESRQPGENCSDQEQPSNRIQATYSEKTCKDFVPAVRITGHLECLGAWKNREHRWLSQGEIDAVTNMEVFFVARYAPVNPSRKDFCLSFTLAENKLAECLSPVQRSIVLIMKAFLKGVYTKMHQHADRDLKLTTFHVKTILYRVSDVTDPCLWSEVNLLDSLIRVLEFLNHTLLQKELTHYFVESNLYAGLENADFELLLQCTSVVMADPVGSLHEFFALDDGIPTEIWLTEEDVAYLERISQDGGVSDEVDRLEEFILEMLRGMTECARDTDGNAPIREAVSTALRLFIRDEAQINFREKVAKNLPTGSSQLLVSLAEAFGGVLVSSVEESVLSTVGDVLDTSVTGQDKQRAFDTLKYHLVAYFAR